MRFFSDHEGYLKPSPNSIPVKYRTYLIPFALVSYYETDGYSILSQEIRHKGFRIRSHRFFVRTPTLLHPVAKRDLVTLHYMLKGRAKCHIQGLGELNLLPWKYQVYAVPSNARQDVWLEPGESWSFIIGLPTALQEQIAIQYEDFSGLLKNLKQRQGATLRPLLTISRRTFSLIRETLDCREEKIKRTLYLCERISSLVYAYLRELDAEWYRQQRTSHSTIKLHELENYIRANLNGPAHDLTIANLAQASGLSIHQFHSAFSLLYGIPLDMLVNKIRMETALKLLQERDHSIAAIAEKTGYADTANFSRAFKKYYGKPPSSYRAN